MTETYEIDRLSPHPRNVGIYGDENIDELADRIQSSGGWIKPLVITPNGMIISGHRRWKAAKKLGMKTVPVEVHHFANEAEELEALLLENVTRQKTNEQTVRELDAWREIEEAKARDRQLAQLKRGDVVPVSGDLRTRDVTGRTTDLVAAKANMSGSTYERAAKVVKAADEIRASGDAPKADALLSVLNKQGVDTAHKIVKQPDHVRDATLKAIAAAPEIKAQQAMRQAVAEDIRQTASLPDAKYRVVYADPPWKYGNTMPDYFTEQADHYPLMTVREIAAMPIAELCEDNAVLFLWVTSPILAESFEIVRSWGFTYKSSFIWDKVKHNMGHYNSVRHEILLICVRGSCQPDVPKLFDSVVSIERTEHSVKPPYFRELIDTIYPNGKRIELFARQTTEGWSSFGNQL